MSKPAIRCAIYTRKSSDEGLDQAFNSLEAQREACAAYVASQRHEGWALAPGRYDDGGHSGGTLDRPALQRLLADIDAGRIRMVVVYKIDRLTRSLTDFARLVDRLEAAGCSFVSVTQAFNTSSSMGRLTLNVLLSFAQFEREVTAERIRDKIAASKRKGLWMGGLPPLGYDPHPDRSRRELVANETEAATVRQLFALYLAHGCLNATAQEAGRLGLCSKRRRFDSGRVAGGQPFSRGQLHKILTNPVYRGLIRHRDKTWPGTHPAILDAATWDAVQHRLQAASARRRGTGTGSGARPVAGSSAPLLGKVFDETGDLLTPSHTRRHGRRLRYYISNRLVSGGPDPTAWRLPAPALEQAVARAVTVHLAARARHHAVRTVASAAEASAAAATATGLAARINAEGLLAIAPAIARLDIAPGTMRLRLEPAALAAALEIPASVLDPALLAIETTFTCRRRGVEMTIVAGDRVPAPDPAMLRALRNAHRWATALRSGQAIHQIATACGVSESYVARVIPLATLSPRIQGAIVAGTQPAALTLETLVRSNLPLDWADQERLVDLGA